MFGGVKNLEENKRTSRVTKVWLCVGKLRDICWEALCHYTPNLPSLPPSALLQMGIPQYIVDSLHHQTPAYGQTTYERMMGKELVIQLVFSYLVGSDDRTFLKHPALFPVFILGSSIQSLLQQPFCCAYPFHMNYLLTLSCLILSILYSINTCVS